MTNDYHYEPWEVCLFKENKNAHMWVVEYRGSGRYFNTFEEAIDYLCERHTEDDEFATCTDVGVRAYA